MALMPDAKVARFFGVCSKTIERWDADEKLNFPPAIEINGRRYRDAEQLNAFIRARAKRSISEERAKRGKARQQRAEAQAGGAA
jgi:hypothetical protein